MIEEDAPVGHQEAEEAKAQAEKKKEKWTCSSCGAKNFAAVDECHKCGSRKPSEAELLLVEERGAAQNDLKKVMDNFLRLQAELQNYRRQHQESMARAQELGRQDALRKLVPLMEDIAEAVVAPEDLAEGDKSLFDSYSLLFKKVTDAYGKFGVDVLATAAGERFDQLKHRKAEEREAPGDEAPGTILEVLKTGWAVDGKVLIPSDVVVVAAPKEEEKEEEEEEAEEEEEEMAEDSAETEASAETEGAEGEKEGGEAEAKEK